MQRAFLRHLGTTILMGLSLSASACVGLDSGAHYPDVSDVNLNDYLLTPEGDPEPSVSFNQFKIAPKTCEGIDTRLQIGPLDQEDLSSFFAARGLKLEPKRARGDLYWYELPTGEVGQSLRLRVAILKDRNGAAKDLHDSLLQHGPGWWGVRRGNLAVLAPATSLREAMQFAVKHRLVCWGTFTYAGADDVYTVAGGYNEF